MGGNTLDGIAQTVVALIAPDGTITRLALEQSGSVRAVDINGFLSTNITSPKIFGTSSYSQSIFALSSQVLNNHLIQIKNPISSSKDLGLVVDAAKTLRLKSSSACVHMHEGFDHTIWAAPVFFNSYQDSYENWPKVTNWVGGGILGLDFHRTEDVTLGLAGAYAFDRSNLSSDLGHSNYNQFFASIYGAKMDMNLFIDAAIWGGYYKVENTRSGLLNISSSSNYTGWLLMPHIELSFPFYKKNCDYLLDPFVMIDWANNWQGAIKETGPSGFNLVMDSTYTSLLRSEGGVRFIESFSFKKLNLILLEKASFVNKLPFDTSPNQAVFFGGTSLFAVDTFSDKIENLGAIQISATLVPKKSKSIYASLNAQGEFGSGYQSYLVSFELGLDF